MPVQSAILNTLIQTVRELDPTLADVLLRMAEELDRIATAVDPAPVVPRRSNEVLLPAPNAVTVLTYTFTRTNVHLRWEAASTGFLLYELRKGTVWETAERILTTGNLIAIIDPLPVGTTTFLLKSINSTGGYALTAASVDVIVPPMGAMVITANVINNFVTLSWTIPTFTFAINYFTITRNGVVYVADLRGTFISIQEPAAGRYTYSVNAEDIAGNRSPIVTVVLDVTSPLDYDFVGRKDSTFSGPTVYYTNGVLLNRKLYLPINTVETIKEHFDNHGVPPWQSPQDQIDDNYPLWIQPTRPTAEYQEVFDFGYELSNVVVGADWSFENVVPSFIFGFLMSVSLNGVDFGPPTTNQTQFFPKVRYVKTNFTFSGADGRAIMMFVALSVVIYVKRENDGGEADISASDVGGTTIFFKKTFKLIESITVTPLQNQVVNWAYDYDGGPDPVSFTVYLWNSSGVRIDGHISWKARGIV